MATPRPAPIPAEAPRRAARASLSVALLSAVAASPSAYAAEFWDRAHAPPAPRTARLQPDGTLSVGVGMPIEAGVVDAEIYTRSGTLDERMPLELMLPDLNVRVGLGDTFELGITATLRAQLRWALLDEEHDQSPLSLALAADAGWSAGALGLQLSRDLPTRGVVMRPTLGLWFGYHRWAARTQLPPSARTPTDDSGFVSTGSDSAETSQDEVSAADPGLLRIEQRGLGFLVPLGVEVDLQVSDSMVVVPFVAWEPMIGAGLGQLRATCGDCLAGLGEVDRKGIGTAWLGVRLDQRARPEAPPPPARPASTPTPGAPAQAAPTPAVSPSPDPASTPDPAPPPDTAPPPDGSAPVPPTTPPPEAP
ncbi:MAG: hypothetical protein JNM72_21195 [Deltaproteobacteria bacterium]|nr:hypothetical protein [Deltaproteobacteria bacterium]